MKSQQSTGSPYLLSSVTMFENSFQPGSVRLIQAGQNADITRLSRANGWAKAGWSLDVGSLARRDHFHIDTPTCLDNSSEAFGRESLTLSLRDCLGKPHFKHWRRRSQILQNFPASRYRSAIGRGRAAAYQHAVAEACAAGSSE